MIKFIVSLVVILTLALIVFNIYNNIIDVKIKTYNQTLEKIPVIVLSSNDTLLYKISSELDTLKFVDNILPIMSDTLRKNLIKKYKLEAANKYLNNSFLPNMLKIFIKSGEFNTENKEKIAVILKKYKDEISIKYNDELWREITIKTDFLKNFFKDSLYVFFGFLVLIILILNSLYEKLSSSFWTKYLKSGGTISKWVVSHITKSILVALLSVGLSYFVFYPIKMFSPYFAVPDIKLAVYEFIGIFLINLLPILMYRKKNV